MDIKAMTKLKESDFNKQLAFAYLTCERLYPNYVYFSNNFDFGTPQILREAIEFLRVNIFEQSPDKNKIKFLKRRVDKNTPDTEDFTTIFVSSALDACTALSDSLDFLVDKDFTRIENVSTYATDTVSMYVQDLDNLDYNADKNFQQKIESHPLMQREITIQLGIISFLNKRKILDYEDLQTLLNLQENNKKSNLEL
jgi:uncharacterized protein YjaG (DUF416 family)